MNSAKKLVIDDGLLRLDINGNGILTFNASDLNVYERFYSLVQELPAIEKKYASDVESVPENATEEDIMTYTGKELERARAIDAEVKSKLSAVFGAGNDFDVLLGGINIMSFGSNGERVITNLLSALTPYIEEGVEKYTKSEAANAKRNREQRRAMQKASR